jgi:hypothetical protein
MPPPEGAHGELLLRVLRWLAEFPFGHVGIETDGAPYVPLTTAGLELLRTYARTQTYDARLLATASSERYALCYVSVRSPKVLHHTSVLWCTYRIIY